MAAPIINRPAPVVPPRVGGSAPLPTQMLGSFQNQQLGGLIQGTQQGLGDGPSASPQFQALQNKLSQTSVDLKQRQNSVVDGAKRLTQINNMAKRNQLAKKVSAPPKVSQQGMVKAGSGGYVPTGRAKGKGQIDISQTIKIGKAYLRADAATEFQKMNAALKAATGKTIGITEGWRSYDRQVQLYQLYKSGKGNVAAKPGTSNHGRGTAVDINGYGGYNSPVFQWLLKNARNYGYSWDTGKASGELWHWEYVR